MTVLMALALVISTILSWQFLMGGSMVGCGGGSPCDNVINSRWSSLGGILPVSSLAVGAYLALLIASMYTGPGTESDIRVLAWSSILVIAGAVAGSAIWFTILQKWYIGSFCPYCMTAHCSGMLLTILVIWRALKETDIQTDNKNPTGTNINSHSAKPLLRPLKVTILIVTGLILAGIMAFIQVTMSTTDVHTNDESQNSIPLVDYKTSPIIGSPEAPFIVTVLFDYQCSHCQKLHFMLSEAVSRYNGKLAFVLCPAQLNAECNPYVPKENDSFKNSCDYARISLAVWLGNKEAFSTFEDYMFTFESGELWRPRTLDAAKSKAEELLGKEKFESALKDPWIDKYMQSCVQIYGKSLLNGRGGVPKMIYGSNWIIPEPYNTDELITILQRSLSIPLL